MAVYTESPTRSWRAFLAELRHRRGASRCKGIAEGVENSNYLLQTEQRQLHPDALREAGGAGRPAVLPRADGASRRAAASPARRRCKARDGAALRELCGRPAAIVSFLDGLWPRRTEPRHCAALGEALARLHLAGADFAHARGPTRCRSPAGDRCSSAAATARRRSAAGPRRASIAAELDALEQRLAARPAAGRDPCRPLPRQRLLPAASSSPG